MSRIFTHDSNRDDEDQSPVTVEYTFVAGCPAHMGSMSYAGHPAEGPEIEIRKAWHTETKEAVVLTEAEENSIVEYLASNHTDNDERDWDLEAKDERSERGYR